LNNFFYDYYPLPNLPPGGKELYAGQLFPLALLRRPRVAEASAEAQAATRRRRGKQERGLL